MRTRLGGMLLALLLLTAGGPANAAWHEARTKHFIIYADQRPDELRQYAERLERFDQAVRLVRRMKDPPLSDANRVRIYALNNVYSIEKLYGGSGIAGFYISRVSGSVAFVPRKAGSKHDRWEIDAETVFFHEYAHHLQLQSADVALLPWISEGFAEFFGRTQLREDGSVVIGVPPAYRAYSLLEYNDLSMREMLGGDTTLSDTEFEGIYGKGWLLTHYLTFAPQRRGQLERYIASIQKGVQPLAAAQQAFGDLAKLGGEIGSYLRRKTLPHLVISSVQVPTGTITLRPLTAGESAMMPVHMRTVRGATKKTERDIAGDARRIAAGFPNDPFVQTALAEAEFDVEQYAAADAAASRALAAQPNRIPALIVKGKAQMELARKAGAAADWRGVRQWFLRANKLDPEAAEPLLRFYETYVYAGAQPPKNAVDGLLYALALAPQDSLLRIIAVRQLVTEGRMADARRYFAPFAFEPHWTKKWRDASGKAMAAITGSRRDEALVQLNALEKLIKDED